MVRIPVAILGAVVGALNASTKADDVSPWPRARTVLIRACGIVQIAGATALLFRWSWGWWVLAAAMGVSYLEVLLTLRWAPRKMAIGLFLAGSAFFAGPGVALVVLWRRGQLP